LKILLTNDDGFEAEGLRCLFDILSKTSDCYLVAPDEGRSCCSHGVTTGSTLEVNSIASQQWTVSGTPADCVRVGLLWLGLKPDWVVSGVNHGGNLGVDILYSGTVAGAREASLLGVPAVAISQYMRRDVARDWSVSAKRAEFVLKNIFSFARLGCGFWNVNLPALPPERDLLDPAIQQCEPEMQPLAFSLEEALGIEEKRSEFEKNQGSLQQKTLLYKSNYQDRPRILGSDVELCFSGYATVSWLTIDRVSMQVA
jgi:5'-nucleotidase